MQKGLVVAAALLPLSQLLVAAHCQGHMALCTAAC